MLRAKLRSPSVLVALVLLSGTPLKAQLAPPSTGGVVALDRLLQQLGETRRLLIIGAHPDDEDTRLLAYAAQRLGADVAYLSLSRGEGGQNLIGDELGIGLGLLRTGELAAARRVDGARQFFTRAYDFGYSRSLEETEVFWPPDSVLEDVVRIVRRFRPHVVVSVFSGTPRDGHGQHQLAGIVARRAFEAAGDASRFPHLALDEGLEPWQPLELYQSTMFNPDAATLTLETGQLDPRTGKSYGQIAMASRSQHRSQDMGQLQEIGPQRTTVGLVEDLTGRAGRGAQGEGDSSAGLFVGVPADTSWLKAFADSLRAHVSAARLSDAAEPIAAALERARRDRQPLRQQLLLQRALSVAGGLVLDATADRDRVTPGATVRVTVTLYNGGPFRVPYERIRVRAPEGWKVEETDQRGVLESGAEVSVSATVTVPSDEPVTQPYFLRRDVRAALYDWSLARPSERGEPFQAALMHVTATASVAHEYTVLTRDVTYRYNDQAVGEVRHPLQIVPPLEVRLAPRVLLWANDGPDRQFLTATLTSNVEDTLRGLIELEADRLVTAEPTPFAFAHRGESRSFALEIVRPLGMGRDTVAVRAVARTEDGGRYDAAVTTVSYDHVDPVSFVEPARTTVRFAPIALPDVGRVGYVRGASDRVPEALVRLGLDVVLLDAEQLARGELSDFDVIVIGSRAYEVDPALVRNNDRLLDYVRDGGRLVVQYQQYQFVTGGYAPYPLTISRPHDRITDENAPVRMLDPDHPVFRVPNQISEEDWLGWPQERGLYFAGEWDDHYTPLLEMTDPGMAPMQGGLLVAGYGRGTYVYTGVSFFRAIPAGVPGAVRLFLNLLADGRIGG